MVAPEWSSFQGVPQEEESPQYTSQEEKPQQSTSEESSGPAWGDFQSPSTQQGPIDPTAEEDTFGYLTRNWLQLQSRAGEQVIGKAGNIEKFSKDILSNFPQVGGILGYSLSKLVGPESWDRIVRGPQGQQQLLPTSQDVRELTKRGTGGYTEPKTKGEKVVSEFSEDVAAALSGKQLPIPKLTEFQSRLVNNLGIPASANAVKQIVGGLGFGEDVANMSKLAAWTTLSLLGNVNASNYAANLLNESKKLVPSNLRMNIPRLFDRFDKVRKNLLASDPRNAIALQQLAKLEEDIAKGQVTVKDGMGMSHGTNATKRSKGMFEYGKSTDRDVARGAVDDVNRALNDEIAESLAGHPEALEYWKNGNQAWAVIQQSKRFTNWIEDLIKGPYSKFLAGPAAALFGIAGLGVAKYPLLSKAATPVLPAAYKAGQVAYRAYSDPRLAKYYWDALSNVARKDAPSFISNYNKLNRGLEKALGTNVLPIKPSNKKESKKGYTK